MSLRKIKRNMARKQLEAEGRRRINKTYKSPNGISKLASDFSYDWQTALARRVKYYRQKEAGAK